MNWVIWFITRLRMQCIHFLIFGISFFHWPFFMLLFHRSWHISTVLYLALCLTSKSPFLVSSRKILCTINRLIGITPDGLPSIWSENRQLCGAWSFSALFPIVVYSFSYLLLYSLSVLRITVLSLLSRLIILFCLSLMYRCWGGIFPVLVLFSLFTGLLGGKTNQINGKSCRK